MCHQFAGNIELDAASKVLFGGQQNACMTTFLAKFGVPEALRCSGTHLKTVKGSLMSLAQQLYLLRAACTWLLTII